MSGAVNGLDAIAESADDIFAIPAPPAPFLLDRRAGLHWPKRLVLRLAHVSGWAMLVAFLHATGVFQ